MRAGARIDEGLTVEDVTDRLVVLTVTGESAVLRLSDALWELDRRGELAVYAAMVLAPLDGTYGELNVNCPDAVPSARDVLRMVLNDAERAERAAPTDPDYAALTGCIAGLRTVTGAAVIAEIEEEDPEHLDAAVKRLDGQIFRAPQCLVTSALHAEARLWTLRKKASRSEGDARRRHLERAERLSRTVRG